MSHREAPRDDTRRRCRRGSSTRATHLRDEEGFNFLSDITAVDYLGWGEPGVSGYIGTRGRPRPEQADDAGLPGRAAREAEALRGQLPPALGLATARAACALQVWLDEGEAVPSVIAVWPTADWHEREAWDLMGIAFDGPPEPEAHPARRRLGRAPAAQGLPASAASPCASRGRSDRDRTEPRRARRSTRARASRRPIPTVLKTPPELQATGDVMTINFGPNHPSTHGVLRLVVDLYGEDVTGLEAVIGYLHTGFEKNMEQKTWWKAITVPGAHRLRLVPEQRVRLRRARSRSCSTSRCRRRRSGCARCSAS